MTHNDINTIGLH